MRDSRFDCKFCHKNLPVSEMSTVHINLCRTCQSKVSLYKRALLLGAKTDKQREAIMLVEKQINYNLEHGGYVPSYYKAEEKEYSCAYCGVKFKSRVKSEKCPDCYSKEYNYRTLIRRYNVHGIETKQLVELEDYYTEMQRRGFKVPKAFVERNTRRGDVR